MVLPAVFRICAEPSRAFLFLVLLAAAPVSSQPVISNISPDSGPQPIEHGVPITFSTDQPAVCRFTSNSNLLSNFDSMSMMESDFAISTGPSVPDPIRYDTLPLWKTSHRHVVSNFTVTPRHTYYVKCKNQLGQLSTHSTIDFSSVSGGSPNSPQALGQQVTLAVSTSEPSSCRFSAQANQTFAAMAPFTSDVSGPKTLHSTSGASPLNGERLFYYVKCQDGQGKTSVLDYVVGYSGISTAALDNLIPADRRITWANNVGVLQTDNTTRGIPSRPTPNGANICADVSAAPYNADKTGSTDATPAFKLAVRHCLDTKADNQVISVPAGTYRLNGPVEVQKTWGDFLPVPITIRGAGSGVTTIKQYGSGSFTLGGSSPYQTFALGNDAQKGDSNINLVDPSIVKVGQLLRIEQDGDPSFVIKNGNNQTPAGLKQWIRVTGKSGNNITFVPPLYLSYTTARRATVIPYYYFTDLTGVEDMTIDHVGDPGSDYAGIWINGCTSCWIKNVESKNAATYHFAVANSLFTEIRDSYLHSTTGVAAPNQAGIILSSSGGALIENNSFDRMYPSIEAFGDVNGSAFAYNYSYKPTQGGAINSDYYLNHGPFNHMDLWEGNVGVYAESDGYFGGASHHTLFRNWFSGTHPDQAVGRIAVALKRWTYYFNLVGNVFGIPNYNNSVGTLNGAGQYEALSRYNGSFPVIYQFGFPNVGNNWGTGLTNPPHLPVPVTKPEDLIRDDGTAITTISNQTLDANFSNGQFDLNVAATTYRHGNFDYVSNAVVWHPAVNGRVLPASMYLSSKPAWFGNLPFPAIGPDVSGGNQTRKAATELLTDADILLPMANKIPAQVCFEQGKMPNCLITGNSFAPSAPQNLKVQ